MFSTVDGNEPLRVLTLSRDIGRAFGGEEQLAFEFATRLDPARFTSYVCITHAPPPAIRSRVEADVEELAARGVKVLRLERRSTASVVPWLALYRLLKRERIDVVHGHMPRASIPGTVLGRLAGVPVIVSQEHGWASDRKRIRQFMHRNVVGRWSDVLLAVSERGRRDIIAAERMPADRISVLPNAIAGIGETARADRRRQRQPPVIGTVGRLAWQKGHDDLIRAIGILRSRSRVLRCVIAGDGPEEERLRALIEALDLADEVKLMGRVADGRALASDFDVAVMSSKSEGSPLALIEYMGAGLPIVASAVGGIPELIEDGVHGLLVPPEDPSQLAAAIERLLDDPSLAERLGAAAKRRQRAEFDLDVVVERLQRLYTDLYMRSATASRRSDSR